MPPAFAGASSQGAGAVFVGNHVVFDEELRSLRDQAVEGLQGRTDVVRGIEALADVVQQCRQQELDVVRPAVLRLLEYLE